ncbi:GNAT family N-acetyltransferase [Companilactobacillus crustorum]|uniref:GNAT family N-acetyltransferase n=1 Tax=Companilactobacillus crustorum TaxID=392416 RepID=UPI000EF06CD6|nr:GNAT family N-acetyltransferase [Companilactobacillus crustorum]WDT65648.1 GNAT family N-acetyltransferase [Companilactobacillus crustorum]HCD06845.1 N-acetyltransferase [Lactobacillus sp.]
MKIIPYQNNPHHLAQLVDLINYCQNIEAKLAIKMAEQDDVFQIPTYYQQTGGNFWIALDQNQVVGSIALLPIDNQTAVLKKFFTYPKFRGNPVHLGSQLYHELSEFARKNKFERIVLDTPELETRSHYFYEKHGFKQVTPANFNVSYAYPDRNSRLYELYLN